MDGLVLTGEVRTVETLRGNKNGRDWVMILVHMLADVQMFETQLGRDWKGPLPEKGERGSFLVVPRAYLSGGSVRLGMDLLGRADEQARPAPVHGAPDDDDVPARALESVG